MILRPRNHDQRTHGYTLVELLVVVLIVLLVSAVTLPTILPALSNRQVGEAARILQGGLAGARDAAIRANAPRGIRFFPDITIGGSGNGSGILTSSRYVPIEPAPDLTDSSDQGSATFATSNAIWTNAGNNPPFYPFPIRQLPLTSGGGSYPHPSTAGVNNVLMVVQAVYALNNPLGIPNPPTNWFWNVRIGDRFRFNDSGHYYTVVGPMTLANPENFINDGPPDHTPYSSTANPSLQDTIAGTNVFPEFLFLVNGQDDNGDGYIDPGLDGLDQNLDGYADDIGEWGYETEGWLGSQALSSKAAIIPTFQWTITRRPVPSPGAREVSLPAGSVIDLTTWNAPILYGTNPERSRLPVDAINGTVDILLNQAGQVVPTTFYSSPSSAGMDSAFYHFWISDRADVNDPIPSNNPQLPIPASPYITATGITNHLKKDMQLVTLFTRTGQLVTNSISVNFDFVHAYNTAAPFYNSNLPYLDAQLGIREAK